MDDKFVISRAQHWVNPRKASVLVIGGSAGSIEAALLAGRGCRVTLLEKLHHPYSNIGESLMPSRSSA